MDEVELYLYDPVRDQRRYGSLSKLVESLLVEWLKNNQEEEDENDA